MDLPPNHLALFEEARRYDEKGDPYVATKLYKKIIRLVPDFVPAYECLGRLYHKRREWKPAFHYWKKALALDANLREAWWKLGLAAVGLKKMRIAQSIWMKFGLGQATQKHPVGLRIAHPDGYEILWMQALDPARGRIISIPHPGSGLRYRETMLYDRRMQRGTNVVAGRRIPIYEAVASLKSSPYGTFSCLLHTANEKALSQLEQLCYDAAIGFEVWSNASQAMLLERPQAFPEYYQDILPRPAGGDDTTLVAMAALHPAEIERLLNNWQIISLQQYSDLHAYNT